MLLFCRILVHISLPLHSIETQTSSENQANLTKSVCRRIYMRARYYTTICICISIKKAQRLNKNNDPKKMQETFMRFVCVKRVSNVHNSINIRCFIHAGTFVEFVEWLICMAYKDFYLPFGIFCAEPNCAQLFLCSNKTAFLYTYILHTKKKRKEANEKRHTSIHSHRHTCIQELQ